MNIHNKPMGESFTKTLRFRRDNRIRYGQDSMQYCGIPSGVDFVVERFGEGVYRLCGDGFGFHQPNGEYGDGALYVWGLNAKQRRLFEDACQS